MKANESIDRYRRARYGIGNAEFSLGMKCVDLALLQRLAVPDPSVPSHFHNKERKESKRKAKAKLRAAKHKLAKVRAESEQGAKEYYIAGSDDCPCQIICYK